MNHPIHIVGGGLAGQRGGVAARRARARRRRARDARRARNSGAQDRPARRARLLEHVQEHRDVQRARIAQGGDAAARLGRAVGRGRGARARRDRAGRRSRRVLGRRARARDVASANHRRARRGHGAAEPGDRRHGSAHVRRAWPRRSARDSASSRSRSTTAIAPIVAHESIDESVVFRASRYGKETMDARRGRRRSVSQLSVHARTVRGVHRRARRGRSASRRTSSTRCRTSRGACPSRRWRGAAARRCASAR